MAKWAYSEEVPRRKPVPKFLYLQCDCEDSEYGPMRGFLPEAFMARLEASRQVRLARPTDMALFLETNREEDKCVWCNELGQYEILTLTKDKKGTRKHKVLATIDGGLETEWVCKHCITAARYIGRRMWNVRHLYVHLPDDPLVIKRFAWAKYQAGDELEVKTMRLTRHVCVTGWGYYNYGSGLSRKE